MTPDTLAIGLFLLGFGFVIGLTAVCFGLTLFRDEQQQTSYRERFWLDKLIRIQKPEYQRFSYGLVAIAVFMMMSGTAWILYHQH